MDSFWLLRKVLVAAALYSVIFDSNGDEGLSHQIAEVVSVNNERVTIIGTGRLGDQKVTVKLDNGQLAEVENLLTGALEYDEFYQVGDTVVVAEKNNRYHVVSLFRLPVLIGLLLLFCSWSAWVRQKSRTLRIAFFRWLSRHYFWYSESPVCWPGFLQF